ncbi:MAG TPA: hypothetical protein VM261_32070 [Kofleriaceae bacterium]|nr:hypothetical protein [Kofleriaceae bacterium]
MIETFSFDVRGDIYRMHRRPNAPHVVVNDDYRGVRVIDPRSGEDYSRVAFSPDYAASGIVNGWAFSADGDLVATFDDDAQRGCLLSLAKGTRRVISHPGWISTFAMPYDWRDGTLWLHDAESFSFASIDASTGITTGDDGFRALQENRSWRRALDRMRRMNAGSVRVEPELAHSLVIIEGDGKRVGRIGWADQPDLVVAAPSGVCRLAAMSENLITLAEYEVRVLSSNGETLGRHVAPAGFHFLDVETLPETSEHPAVIVTLASALDGSRVSRITSYALN